MRVKLCARCPYTPQDLATHYDPKAVLHLCAKCDNQQEASSKHYQRETYRRQECATVFNSVVTAQPSVARSARESLAWSDTTPGEPPFARKSVPTDSRPAERTIADFCLGSRPPETGRAGGPTIMPRGSRFRIKEVAQ
jgi:hypothetical protein